MVRYFLRTNLSDRHRYTHCTLQEDHIRLPFPGTHTPWETPKSVELKYILLLNLKETLLNVLFLLLLLSLLNTGQEIATTTWV